MDDTADGRRLDAARYEMLGRLIPGLAHELNTPTQYLGDNAAFFRGAWQDLGPLFDAVETVTAALPTPGAAIGAATGPAPGAIDSLAAAVESADVAYLREEMPTAIDQSVDGARRVASIVAAMAAFAGERTRERSRFDLRVVAANTLVVAHNTLKYHADVTTEYADTPQPVDGYAGDISLALLHLLINAAEALKASRGEGLKARGRITLRTRSLDGVVELTVADSGPGLAAAVRDDVLTRPCSTRESGRGHGLLLAREIVTAHGGTIAIAAAPADGSEGMTVTLQLPLAAA